MEEDSTEFEKFLLSTLPTDSSGFIIYPGDGPISTRKGYFFYFLFEWNVKKNVVGSPIHILIDWWLRKPDAKKPLDADLFEEYLHKELGIKTKQTKSTWKRLEN
jgi:hypothetical protein